MNVISFPGNPISYIKLHELRQKLKERVPESDDKYWVEVRCGETPGLFFIRNKFGDVLVARFVKFSGWYFYSLVEYFNSFSEPAKPEPETTSGTPSA